jgi:hypothetical protein
MKQLYALYKVAGWMDETGVNKGGWMYGVLTGSLFFFY